MAELDLQKIRKEIDEVDQALAVMFEKRMEIVGEVARYKLAKGLPVRDPAREEEVIARSAAFIRNEKYAAAFARVMRSIIEEAVSSEVEAGVRDGEKA